jgi:hypothetical protein
MYPVYVVGEENSENFVNARLTHMRQMVTFSELSNDVDTTETGSMRVVASRVAVSYGWTQRWLGDGSAEVDQLLGLLGRQI